MRQQADALFPVGLGGLRLEVTVELGGPIPLSMEGIEEHIVPLLTLEGINAFLVQHSGQKGTLQIEHLQVKREDVRLQASFTELWYCQMVQG